jgi:KipI family sensor histidine kinase inhibitor
MKVLPYGERAVLAELDDPHLVPALRAAAANEPGVVDAVAGARTVLVVFDPAITSASRVRDALGRSDLRSAAPQNSPRSVDVPVMYDGADLASVADNVDLSPSQLIDLHAGAEYTVRFCGFSPGFAYLDGLDPRLHVARHSSPRTAVPAGSVAIAGEFTGVYPRSSPGGWQLLGRTDATLWDVSRDPPALLTPGTRVRFVPA